MESDKSSLTDKIKLLEDKLSKQESAVSSHLSSFSSSQILKPRKAAFDTQRGMREFPKSMGRSRRDGGGKIIPGSPAANESLRRTGM